MKFPIISSNPPKKSLSNNQTSPIKINKQFMILTKNHTGYNVALKKIDDAKKAKNKGPVLFGGENNEFYRDLMKVQHKKIEKSTKTTRIPLTNLTNLCLRPSFLEDKTKAKVVKETNNYQVLGFLNAQTKDVLLFKCFEEKELNFPAEYASKTITHSLDNDVTTDEEQVKSAIQNLKNSVKESVLKRNQEKNHHTKNPPQENPKRAIFIR